VHRFDLSAGSRKKGQYIKKSQNGYNYFTYLGKPLVNRFVPKVMVGDVHDVITCENFKLKWVTSLQKVEFSIFLLIFAWALQQCSANALLVIILINLF